MCDSQEMTSEESAAARRSTRLASQTAKAKMSIVEELSSKLPYFLKPLHWYFVTSNLKLKFMCFIYIYLAASILMNQVCCLAKFARSGWEGFERAPPTEEDCIKAIENLDPQYKGIRDVILSFF